MAGWACTCELGRPLLALQACAMGCAMTDEERERLIEAWRVVLELEPIEGLKRIAADNMRHLIAQRSPQQVERMEVNQSLR